MAAYIEWDRSVIMSCPTLALATTDPGFSISLKDYIDLTQDEEIARTLQKEYAVQVQQRKRQEELDFRLVTESCKLIG